MVGQPDAVCGEVEEVAVAVHVGGVYLEDDGLASAGAYRAGGVHIGGEVDVVAGHLFETFAEDGVEELLGSAVVEGWWWSGGL